MPGIFLGMQNATHHTAPDSAGRVGFAVGTGRNGTHFIARLFDAEPRVASSHERHPLSDAYDRYARWNELPVDDAGFLHIKEQGVIGDLAGHDLSFEASAYLSLSVEALHDHLGARFLLLLRRPEKVVSSLVAKGWYSSQPVRRDPTRAIGYQPGAAQPHHPFSRLAPRGEDVERWNDYTQVGRCAWYWRVLNEHVLDSFERLPHEASTVLRLEDLDYPAYLDLAHFFGVAPKLEWVQFQKRTERRPESLQPTHTVRDWSAREAEEFESEVGALAQRLGYEWRVSVLRDLASLEPTQRIGGIRRTVGRLTRLAKRPLLLGPVFARR